MKTISLLSALLVSAATTACVSEHNNARDPLDLGSIELPDPNARVDESALFDQFLAGESVRRPVVMVEESLFVKFDLRERTVWTQILPTIEEAELAERAAEAKCDGYVCKQLGLDHLVERVAAIAATV